MTAPLSPAPTLPPLIAGRCPPPVALPLRARLCPVMPREVTRDDGQPVADRAELLGRLVLAGVTPAHRRQLHDAGHPDADLICAASVLQSWAADAAGWLAAQCQTSEAEDEIDACALVFEAMQAPTLAHPEDMAAARADALNEWRADR